MNWEVKKFKPKKGSPYIRLKKNFGATTLLIFVGKNGWNYKKETNELSGGWPKTPQGYHTFDQFGTADKNVRISMNGPLMLSWEDYREIADMIEDHYLDLAGEYHG